MIRVSEKQVFYLLLMAAAGYFLHMADSIPSGMGVPGDPGAGFLPFWVSLTIIVLLGYQLITETVIARSDDGNQADAGSRSRLGRREWTALAATVGAIVAYLLLLSLIGFLPSTVAFLFAFRQVSDWLGRDARPTARSMIASALFAVGATGFVYLVFAVLFKLSLP